jgi:hypothetical protein
MANEANQGPQFGGQQQKVNPGQQQPGQRKPNPIDEQESQGNELQRRAPGREQHQGNEPSQRRAPGEGQNEGEGGENERKRA